MNHSGVWPNQQAAINGVANSELWEQLSKDSATWAVRVMDFVQVQDLNSATKDLGDSCCDDSMLFADGQCTLQFC